MPVEMAIVEDDIGPARWQNRSEEKAQLRGQGSRKLVVNDPSLINLAIARHWRPSRSPRKYGGYLRRAGRLTVKGRIHVIELNSGNRTPRGGRSPRSSTMARGLRT
jgi:hypothetical protein